MSLAFDEFGRPFIIIKARATRASASSRASTRRARRRRDARDGDDATTRRKIARDASLTTHRTLSRRAGAGK